jgi:alpha-tubulin suppressor-like RCC1 family protein
MLSRFLPPLHASRIVRIAVVLTFVAGGQAAAQGVEPAVAFGTRHAVALRTNGDVVTWGENIYCQLGRTTRGNHDGTPAIVMRNAKAIAAAAEHALVLTADGKVYGWGGNPDNVLGTNDGNDKCEGPELAQGLADKTVTAIATGYSFSVAVTSDGDLYCTGDNGMGQCGAGRTGALKVFTKVAIPELAGIVAEVRAGMFHTLIRTRDGRLYAIGRGLDGQLGNGSTRNGFGPVTGMTDVVSFAAGTWHSVAARADGSVWMWGNGTKSQICDGGPTTNRTTPVPIPLPPGVKIADVAAAGHGALFRAGDGTLFACGDNQFGPLGIAAPAAATPTPVPGVRAKILLGVGGANGAVSPDGCAVSVVGQNDRAIITAASFADTRTFVAKANLSLCAPRSATPQPTIVNPAPKGGNSGCWTTRVEEDAVASPKFARLRQALLAAEDLLKRNAAFMAPPQPARFRTSISAGPSTESGGRLHVKVVPERKPDGTRLWVGTTGCEVIPQVDRIGGAIAQISIFVNQDARSSFIGAAGEPPARTGSVAGYPEYGHWVFITRDGRMPWIPQTVADRLDEEGKRRREALEEARKRPAGLVPDDAAGGIRWLEKQVKDYEAYRASFTPEQLKAPAVPGDPTGAKRRQLDADIAAARGNPAPGERRQAFLARTGAMAIDMLATFELQNIRPGDAAQAMKVKPDPAFPDYAAPNRIQVIAVLFSFGPQPDGAQLDWQTKVKESFDFARLAALLR